MAKIEILTIPDAYGKGIQYTDSICVSREKAFTREMRKNAHCRLSLGEIVKNRQ